MAAFIISFSEFWQRLNDAMADIDRLAATDADPMIGSIQRQLRFVKQWTQGGQRPAQADLDKLTFGQMASRSVHDVDARLANELYELSSYLIFWPSSEPVRARGRADADPGRVGVTHPTPASTPTAARKACSSLGLGRPGH